VHDAVAVIAPGATAYHSLVNIARLQGGEAVLIHSAASAIGQMAVGIARMVGAEVFVTVSSEEKKHFLIERFSIPHDHVLFSGDSSFAPGVMRQTGGRGVDVVLNSLPEAGLQGASWECLAPYGRFVDISGKVDKNSAGLAMAMSGNLTFAVVDFEHIVANNSKLTRRLVHTILDLVSRGQVDPPLPTQVYPVSEIEKAFRHVHGGDTGSTIVSMGDDDVVPKFLRLKSTWCFDADASYLVAGGLGGIGRVLLAWMVDRGARHLVVPSRSGPNSSKAARDVISGLRSKGATVLTPCCDVSSKPRVEEMLEECRARGMPPIKGCINAAMVLQVCHMCLAHVDYALERFHYAKIVPGKPNIGCHFREHDARSMVNNRPVQGKRNLESPPASPRRYGLFYPAILHFRYLRDPGPEQLRSWLHISRRSRPRAHRGWSPKLNLP